MDMRVVVPPPRPSIMARALGCGAGYGAALGVATLAVPGLIVSVLERNPSALGFALVFSAVAALAGTLVGVACGVVGGIALVVLRRQAAGSRAATRLIAGAGAALLPAVCAVLFPNDAVAYPFFIAITVMTFGVGVAVGPRVFYGKPRKRKRRTDAPRSAVGG